MAKNLMQEVANLLGVEIGEEFRLDNPDNDKVFRLTADGLLNDDNILCTESLTYLLIGGCKIVKLPWEPKQGELYWVVLENRVVEWVCVNGMTDRSYLKLGNRFHTKEEAEANADRIRKEIMGGE